MHPIAKRTQSFKPARTSGSQGGTDGGGNISFNGLFSEREICCVVLETGSISVRELIVMVVDGDMWKVVTASRESVIARMTDSAFGRLGELSLGAVRIMV